MDFNVDNSSADLVIHKFAVYPGQTKNLVGGFRRKRKIKKPPRNPGGLKKILISEISGEDHVGHGHHDLVRDRHGLGLVGHGRRDRHDGRVDFPSLGARA